MDFVHKQNGFPIEFALILGNLHSLFHLIHTDHRGRQFHESRILRCLASICDYIGQCGLSNEGRKGMLCVLVAENVRQQTLPTPGGPHRIMLGVSFLSRIFRRIASLPITWLCPMYWSIVSGLIFSANGTDFASSLLFGQLLITGLRLLSVALLSLLRGSSDGVFATIAASAFADEEALANKLGLLAAAAVFLNFLPSTVGERLL